MPGSEWPLVVFTLLAQAGVGTLAAGETLGWFVCNKAGAAREKPHLFKSRLLALILSTTGLAMSFLHLGSPLKAINALNNLKSSWLSREILAAVIFLFFLSLSVFLTRKKKPSGKTAIIVSTAAVFAGLFLILAMSILYMLPGVLFWDHVITPLSFFTTTFLLGFMAAGGLNITEIKSFSMYGEKDSNSYDYFLALRTALNTTFILASFQILFAVINSLRIHNYKDIYSPFGSSLLLEHRSLFSLRIILLLAGMVLVVLTQIKLKTKKKSLNNPGWLIYSAFVFMLISEKLGRHLFNVLFYRTGL